MDPGIVLITEDRDLTLAQLVSSRGGFGPGARTNDVRIVRRPGTGEVPYVIHVDFDAVIDGKKNDVVLRADDIVFVPGT